MNFLIQDAEFDLLGINHEEYLIADNFYCVSDMEMGSDGAIYVSEYTHSGAIYKIAPKS